MHQSSSIDYWFKADSFKYDECILTFYENLNSITDEKLFI